MAEISHTPPDPKPLERALTAEPIDPERLEEVLAQIDTLLGRHAADVSRSDGLINDTDRVNRPALERQEGKVLKEVRELRGRAAELHRRAAQADRDDPGLRTEAERLAASLQKLRDAEADLAFETTNTDLGSGE
jgi:hypothetical protein